MKVLVFALVMGIASITSNAQWALMKSDAEVFIKRGTDYIYNCQFDSAEANFKRVIEMYPEHPSGYFLDAMIEWWKMRLNRSYNSKDAVIFLSKIEKELSVCDALLEKNEYDVTGLFFKGGALGYRGRYYATTESWIKAANDGREAFDILIRCQKVAPGNHDIMLGTGIYNYFAAALPEKYPALSTVMIFLPSGDKKIGILQLQAAANKAKFASVEAKDVLLQAWSRQFENNSSEFLKLSEELHTKYPKNPFFHRQYATALVQVGDQTKYEAEWRTILIRYLDKNFGYTHNIARDAMYYIGYSLLSQGKLDDALKYFYKCDEASRYLDEDPSGFMVLLNLKIGMIYDLQGKRDLAIKQYKKVMGWEDKSGSKADAERYLSSPYKR